MPNAVVVEGRTYRIRTDFRAGIEYQRETISGNATVGSLFSIFYRDEMPDNVEDGLEAINRFYRRKDEPVPESKNGKSGPIPYDFLADADAICAAFQREYSIDLTTAKMHWWRFMALLEGLYTYSFSDRVGYRTADLTGLTGKRRAEIIKKRNLFALDQGQSMEDHIAQLDEIIARHGGGDNR